MADKEFGNVFLSENDDGKAVWEFEGLVTSNVPLDTESQHFAGAINELAKKLQQGGGGDEWQLPEIYSNLPEPTGKQIIILLEITEKIIGKPMLSICPMPYEFNGSEYIDWGDGSRVIIKPDDTTYARNYSHAYTAAGLYVITINASEFTDYVYLNSTINGTFITGGNYPPSGVDVNYNNLTASNDCIRVIKFGENIYSETAISGSNDFTGLVYIKYCGNCYNNATEILGEDYLYRLSHYGCTALCRIDYDVPPEKIPSNMYADCKALRNASFAKNLTDIPNDAFSGCTALLSADISSAKTVGSSVFKGCTALSSVDISSAETVGNSAFSNCVSLTDLKYSEDCVFAASATTNCFSLYPKP